jgi:rod shape-determining protein MreC
VIAAYPIASEVLLVNDPDFAAGVVSQKNQTRGTLKGQGNGPCKVDYVPTQEKVEVGEWFYTSGDDRIFPRGFPVGVVTAVREGQPFQEILVEPSGVQHGIEDVLIILSGVHEEIPASPPENQPVYIAPAPPEALKPPATGAEGGAAPATASGIAAPSTEADRLREHYKALGDAQNHVFGENLPGQKPPNFNLPLPAGGAKPAASPPPAKPSATPPGGAKPAVSPPAKSPAIPPAGAGPAVSPPPAKTPATPPGGAGR